MSIVPWQRWEEPATSLTILFRVLSTLTPLLNKIFSFFITSHVNRHFDATATTVEHRDKVSRKVRVTLKSLVKTGLVLNLATFFSYIRLGFLR